MQPRAHESIGLASLGGPASAKIRVGCRRNRRAAYSDRMDLQLTNHVVFVTGASGGIGRAIATEFAAEGAQLVLHGHRNMAGLEEWVAGEPWSDRALCVRANVADPEEVDRAFDAAVERFGRVDALCANAGIWPPAHELLVDQSPERIRATLDANLFGAVWSARAFLRTLRVAGPRADGRGASIVFTGSTAGRGLG